MPTEARKRYFEMSRELAQAKKKHDAMARLLAQAEESVRIADYEISLAEAGVEKAWAAAIDEAEAEGEADSNQDGGEG